MTTKKKDMVIEGEAVVVNKEDLRPGEIVPVAPLTPTISPESAKQAVTMMTKIRTILDKYVQDNLTEGVDYGKIHVGGKDCANKYTPEKCTVAGHFSKPTLFKPGSEKMTQLFNLHAEFSKDDEMLEMAGVAKGTFFLLCRLVDNSGRVWGEGRGACEIGGARNRDANSAIKIAEKRAQMDATLRTFALSDRFTQDMEDGDYNRDEDKKPLPAAPPKNQAPSQTPPTASQKAADAPKPVAPTEKQLTYLHTLRNQYGMTDAAFLEAYKIKSTKDMTREQVSAAIDELKKRVEKGEKWTPKDPTRPPAGGTPAAAAGAEPPAPKPDKIASIKSYDDKIRMASEAELVVVEKELELDTTIPQSVHSLAVGLIRNRRAELAGIAELSREFSGEKSPA